MCCSYPQHDQFLSTDVDRLHKMIAAEFPIRSRVQCLTTVSFFLLHCLFISSVCTFFIALYKCTQNRVSFKWIWRNEKWISIVSLCSLMNHINFFFCLLLFVYFSSLCYLLGAFFCGGVKRVLISLAGEKRNFIIVCSFLNCFSFLFDAFMIWIDGSFFDGTDTCGPT